MKKFVLKTHGCKTNQLESAVICEKLVEGGYIETKKIQDADVYILNSCSVTSNSDDEALRHLRHVKNVKPDILTVLTGCTAQLSRGEIEELSYIDILAGNDDKFNILNMIENNISNVSDIFKVEKFNNQLIHDYAKTRGYLKIQDGCNNYCSYCTIPFARGKSRSNSVENIIEQINIYNNIGVKEVVLTGIHIGQWGQDISSSLKKLLFRIEGTPIERYRLGSLNPLELDDELIDFLSASEKFCPHFHLSLQSLNTKTLFAMNRRYSSELCMELIDKLNNKFELPFLGSDIIVGFPGETDEDFAETLKNAENSGLSNIHVFPYSLRKNTAAQSLPQHLSLSIKKERAQMLKEVAFLKYKEFVEKNIGKNVQILIEKSPDKNSGLLKGVTGNYLNAVTESQDRSLLNTIQSAKIVKFENNILFCNII